MLPAHSELNLRVIGIGNGAERDKGVDSTSMGGLLAQMNERARELVGQDHLQRGHHRLAAVQPDGERLPDVGFEGSRPLEQLHPEELARHAASAARAAQPGHRASLR